MLCAAIKLLAVAQHRCRYQSTAYESIILNLQFVWKT